VTAETMHKCQFTFDKLFNYTK